MQLLEASANQLHIPLCTGGKEHLGFKIIIDNDNDNSKGHCCVRDKCESTPCFLIGGKISQLIS